MGYSSHKIISHSHRQECDGRHVSGQFRIPVSSISLARYVLLLISSAAKGRCGCENSTTLVAPVIGTMTPGDFIIIFFAMDLPRCSVNISGHLNAFWRLTGSSSIAGLGMMAITAAIKEILVPREPFRMRRPGDGGLCTSRG